MVTGRRAFEGDSQASLIANIMNAEPAALASLQPLTPPVLERVVGKCLARHPDDRWDSSNDLAVQLRWIAEERRPGQAPVDTPASDRGIVSPRRRWSMVLPWAIAAATSVAMLTLAMWPRPAAVPRVMRVSLPLPADAPFGGDLTDGIAISRDGQRLAYSSQKGIYVRALSDEAFHLIPGTENGRAPAFSPDGAWLSYTSPQGLHKIPVAGGAPVLLVQSASTAAFVGDWPVEGSILFMPSATEGVMSVSADGGTPKSIVTPAAGHGEAFVSWPQQLENRASLILTVLPDSVGSPDDCRVVLADRAVPGGQTLLTNGTFGRYLQTEHLLFGRAGQILVAPIDLAGRRLVGPSEPIVGGVMTNAMVGLLHAAVSETGTLAYVPGGMQWVGPSHLAIIDRHGVEQTLGRPQPFVMLELSATTDGTKVAVRAGKMNDDIHVFDATAGTFNRASFEGGNEIAPVWSRDGERLAYYASRYESRGIYIQDVAGAGEPHLVVGDDQLLVPSSFSPDSRWLVYGRMDAATGWDIWRVAVGGAGKPEPLIRTRWDELNATVSPDGRRLAFESNEGGTSQAYVCQFPGLGGKRQVSVDGGTEPRWSSDQAGLFFRNGSRLMMSALTGGTSVRSRPPTIVLERAFDRPLRPYGFNYGVLPGGQRFVLARNTAVEPAREIRLILNWFEELKAKVPSGGAGK